MDLQAVVATVPQEDPCFQALVVVVVVAVAVAVTVAVGVLMVVVVVVVVRNEGQAVFRGCTAITSVPKAPRRWARHLSSHGKKVVVGRAIL